MATFHGQLLSGDNVLIEDLEVWIEVEPPKGRTYTWHGGFEVPSGLASHFVGQAIYELHLRDGRKGKIIVTQINDLQAEFQGSGNLE